MKRRGIKKKVTLSTPHKSRDFLLPEERQSWSKRLQLTLLQISRRVKGQPGIQQANHEMVHRILIGMGPDNKIKHQESGARMAVNISSLNVPDFCNNGYRNTYDLQAIMGNEAPRISARRELVDCALPMDATVNPNDIYFGAVELTGAGVRYYGDICLVLKPEAVPASTVILDRNSFEVDRSPSSDRIRSQPESFRDQARKSLLSSWSGRLGADVAAMTTIRLHSSGSTSTRKWTTGHISRGIVDDEDYIEVIKQGSFSVSDIQEARLFSADVALDAYIASRIGEASPPRFEALIWHRRRILSEVALREAGVPIRVVTHLGRERN